jgi:hypothetical protein
MTHDEIVGRITGMADELGYPWHACNSAQRCDGRGFPDLVIVGRLGVLFVEVKPHSFATRTPEQTSWGYALRAAGARYYLWTQADLDDGSIARVLDGLR